MQGAMGPAQGSAGDPRAKLGHTGPVHVSRGNGADNGGRVLYEFKGLFETEEGIRILAVGRSLEPRLVRQAVGSPSCPLGKRARSRAGKFERVAVEGFDTAGQHVPSGVYWLRNTALPSAPSMTQPASVLNAQRSTPGTLASAFATWGFISSRVYASRFDTRP